MNTVDTDALLVQLQATARQAAGRPAEAEAAPQGFAQLLQRSLEQVNALQQQSSRLATAFELGDPQVSLAEVMIARQKAEVAFQAALQVRNKLVQAYKDIMSMPV